MKDRIYAVIGGTITLLLAALMVAGAMSGLVLGVVSMLLATVASALIFLGFLLWSRALVRAGSRDGLFSGERGLALLMITLILLAIGGLVFFWR
jgi:hypothetical protein